MPRFHVTITDTETGEELVNTEPKSITLSIDTEDGSYTLIFDEDGEAELVTKTKKEN